ncbi:MAG TPA: prolyl oligopeptidase family serine peptidase [Solirubrobacterales bacterium]
MRFFKNDQFDFETRLSLGSAYRGAVDAGELLATVERIKDGDYESWFEEFKATGARVREIAERAARAGHEVSAREAYLRASTYLFTSTSSLDGTDDPDRLVPVWREHRDCFDEFAARLVPAAEKIRIPYEETRLEGYFFRAAADDGPRPTLILNNGSDGPVTAMWLGGAAAALERGYNAMTFDGPGQGQALWEQGLTFRPDWEKVVGPVVDFLLERSDVDPGRIAISGMSQGGYWVPRAIAFDDRIAAAIADPGVVDVATTWLDNLPKGMRKHLENEEREKFERQFRFAEHFMGKATRQTIAFRMKPYGTDSPYEAFRAVARYNLADVVDRIRVPLLITDPEDEQFWPGQSRRLYEALPGPDKRLVPFTAAEGANLHCEPMARSLVDQRVFDWLDETLA